MSDPVLRDFMQLAEVFPSEDDRFVRIKGSRSQVLAWEFLLGWVQDRIARGEWSEPEFRPDPPVHDDLEAAMLLDSSCVCPEQPAGPLPVLDEELVRPDHSWLR